MSNLKVVITSGGTISRIDDVRHIGNFSNGTTGARIAETFLGYGAEVHFLYGRGSRRPIYRHLALDLTKPFEEEVERLREMKELIEFNSSRLHEYSIETFEEYMNGLEHLVKDSKKDCIILAAAVSDYSTKKQNGKLSSDLDTYNIGLIRNPKVISLVKTWDPEIFQVGFKLLVNVSKEELIETAYQHGLKNNSDLTVANSIRNGDFSATETYLITPQREVSVVRIRRELPLKILERVYNARA